MGTKTHQWWAPFTHYLAGSLALEINAPAHWLSERNVDAGLGKPNARVEPSRCAAVNGRFGNVVDCNRGSVFLKLSVRP